MAILKNLFARSADDDVARGEKRLAAAVQKLDDKRQAYQNAINTAESPDDPGVVTAAQALAAAEQWHDGVKSALADAQQAQQAAQAADAAAAQEREQKRAASIKANAFKVAGQTGAAVERRINDLVEAVQEALAAQRDLAPYINPDEFRNQIATMQQALPLCIDWHLGFVPGARGTPLDEARARWSRYLPSTMWPA
jgi:hypothetical protein